MAESYEMQVKVYEDGIPVWKSVRCTGRDGYIYRYPTYLKAHQSLDSCYPMQIWGEEKRVIKVDKPANMS